MVVRVRPGMCAAWAFGALHYDFPFAGNIVGWLFLLIVAGAVVALRGVWRKLVALFLRLRARPGLVAHTETGK